jgi:hypothetical protein
MVVSKRAALAVAIFTMLGARAAGQEPRALVEPAERRSGLFTRHQPMIAPRLPVDEDRDVSYGTHWQDRKQVHGFLHPNNSWLDGGMYGRKLRADCVQSHYPFFLGAPGRSTIDCEECAPPNKYWRYVRNAVHPMRPVGSYYSGGSYVPIYDLDYFVPGPGPFPWNHYIKQHIGG